jgi:hypothetical protein
MGCGCLVFLVALAFPRAAIILLFLFSDWFRGVFPGILVPILGFIFLPYTTLWYSVVMRMWDGTWGFWQVAFMVIAVLLDLGVIGGAGRRRRK